MPGSQADVLFQPYMRKGGPFSVEVAGAEQVQGETRPRRNVKAKDGLATKPDPSISTAYDILPYSVKRYGDAKCMGERDVIKVHKETKMVSKVVNGQETQVEKEWQYFELGPYHYMTFVEFQKHVSDLGAGLKQLGLETSDKLHIYGATSLQWMSMAHAAFTRSMTIVTAYDTLGLDGLRSSLQQTKSRAIFFDLTLIDRLDKVLRDVPSIEYLIWNGAADTDKTQLDALSKAYPKLKLLSFKELKALGREHPAEHVPPKPEDLACVMYTSGTSGTPKGVTILHKAIVAAVAGASGAVGDYFSPKDAMLAYLPLAHIIEFVFENAAIFWGATLGYGSPKTLTQASVRNCNGDIAELRPTVLIGVPAVWELIRKGIVSKVESSGALRKNVFWGAIYAKQALLANGLPGTGLIDSLILKPVRAATGGRLRVCLSGGGPIARETQMFMSMALAPIINGYGLTETAGMGALTDPISWTADAQGEIPISIEAKLVDFEEAGYFAASNPPQGELWIRGAPVTEGYFENEEETKAAIRSDGWFMTGDIAEFDHNGHVKIIDRKKNLVKTLKGEYIALEKLESVYRASPLVANICVYAAEDKNGPIAIVVPAEPALKSLAQSNGIQGDDLDTLVEQRKLQDLVLKDLQKVGRQANLSNIELLEGIHMDKDEWTPQNGYMTAAQKIQRKKICEKNKDGIQKAYSRA